MSIQDYLTLLRDVFPRALAVFLTTTKIGILAVFSFVILLVSEASQFELSRKGLKQLLVSKWGRKILITICVSFAFFIVYCVPQVLYEDQQSFRTLRKQSASNDEKYASLNASFESIELENRDLKGRLPSPPLVETASQKKAREDLHAIYLNKLRPAFQGIGAFSGHLQRLLGDRDTTIKSTLSHNLYYMGEKAGGREWTWIVEANEHPETVTFQELQKKFAEFYEYYAHLAEQLQETAESLLLDTANDKEYREWNRVDEEFIEQFKSVTANPELSWLHGQAASQAAYGGDWKIKRLRDK